MPHTRTRIVGSGFTSFNYRGKTIAFLDQVSDSGQQPITPAQPIIPIDAPYPAEIATCRVLDVGTLTATIREIWEAPVWNQLVGLEGANTIVDVFNAVSADPADVTCQMLIKIPGSGVWRGKNYHGCIVSAIDDQEVIAVGNLTVPKNVTIVYTHMTPFVMNAAA